ncbi:mediator of RNA polymerase II transcription subunit 19-like [Amphibalanus amphitrite]|uniref:mediator of RNA polymerase II transcription subunit 19-like n=1 Tax=Amphibalanus amphitrite TaxID=1232801 RepID=UPI001C91F2D6|nr:mediator of RNA polymerase II transcription subunit 19-like [Amphibalanus amphitrite]XP_043217810.1 mediator of RNA polymerase II transcription subunit 19-like [Amphibalanus amphitrite]XP_043217811.1 mediator of RNA polymerase II transcription subunit 19-like [Amphibalanus amphitrite]XP_043217812.1 mediator of RNA polymerase II transcription subunit 19-like [Amphibalanus amphitrite]
MMAGEPFRRVDSAPSPGSLGSPRSVRSPAVPRQDSTGTLRTTIQLGKTGASIVHTGPFYLMKEPVVENENRETGATNLMNHHNLEHSYNKFTGKKMKDSLSSFLTNLPGVIDTPGSLDNSSLRSLIEKPPVVGKELLPLTSLQLTGFRLHAGPLPEQYRFTSQAPMKRKHKHKKHKHRAGDTSSQEGTDAGEPPEKKHKKKRNEDEKERKKKKKEKKKKKQKHSPEHPGVSGTTNGNGKAI